MAGLSEGSEAAKRLCKVLSKCSRDTRCRSGACPVCFRKIRLRYPGGIVAPHIAADGRIWSAVTLIDQLDEFKPHKLRRYNPLGMKDLLRQRLTRSRLRDRSAYAGIDHVIDLTRFPIYRPHWYMLIQAEPDEISEALGSYYPVTAGIDRPILVKKIDKSQIMYPATYMLKSTYKARIWGVDSLGNKKKIGVSMPEAYLQQLLPVLHDWNYVSRIFQRNV